MSISLKKIQSLAPDLYTTIIESRASKPTKPRVKQSFEEMLLKTTTRARTTELKTKLQFLIHNISMLENEQIYDLNDFVTPFLSTLQPKN